MSKKQLNIDPKTFELWKQCRQHGDNKTIAEAIGVSVPVVSDALNVGYVNKVEVVTKINDFFMARIKETEKNAKELAKALK